MSQGAKKRIHFDILGFHFNHDLVYYHRRHNNVGKSL